MKKYIFHKKENHKLDVKIYNLFIDIEKFELFDYTFIREKNYDQSEKNAYKMAQSVESFNIDNKGNMESSKKMIKEQMGEHVHTFTVNNTGEQASSLFYKDGTRLSDVVVLLRFFLGSYVCLENEVEITWSKYTNSPLEHPLTFERSILPKIINIIEGLNYEKVKANKLDKLLLLYFEMHKTIYMDIKISIISPILNILVDLYNKEGKSDDNESANSLFALKEKIEKDFDYNEIERQQISIALVKMIGGLGNDFTTKTKKFLKKLNLINGVQDEITEVEIVALAQLINALRNGIVHTGNLSASGIERKFKGAKLDTDEGTLQGKVRVYSLGTVVVQNAILELLGIDDYHFKEQDVEALEEYFKLGTFRGF